MYNEMKLTWNSTSQKQPLKKPVAERLSRRVLFNGTFCDDGTVPYLCCPRS